MYPDYPYFAVAITRTCGSGGGSYIGKQLAKAFDIDLYDRKLLRLASEDSGISEELFARADENTRKTMLVEQVFIADKVAAFRRDDAERGKLYLRGPRGGLCSAG